jgi:hypothetical protein
MNHATDASAAQTVDEQFLALVCSDEDLLRAEFDAIIAAEWPSPPANTPAHGAADGRRGGGAHRHQLARVAGPVARPHPGIGGWARQRSPPPATAITRQERQVIATRESAFTR